ncbi:MAG: aromatic ring-hydroxylating dioxygenase subunit alpha [Pseudomonadota bacterium]
MSYTNEELGELIKPTKLHRKIYTDPEIFDLEMERIWGQSWIYIGHESQVKAPGDYITLNYGKMPVVMVRDKESRVHVLHNRCGHKGAKLVDMPCGSVSAFRCCYHGWTYKLDGKLTTVPHPTGYDGTGFDKNDPQYSMVPVTSASHRGFIFATMNPNPVELKTWLGGAGEVLDNLCDRSPEGEVEAAGGVLRYEHDCNWKLFLENLNDTMHPMIVHRSVVDSALEYIKTLPDDADEAREEAQIIPPFGASYKKFEETGITGFPFGHHYDGGKQSIHADYSVDPEYEQAMIAAYGIERTREIFTFNTHNTLYYPSITIKSAIQNIRVVRPIAYNKTIIETWSFRLKGAPESLLQRTLLYSRLINANGSMVGPDDLTAYVRVQEGLQSSGNDWVEIHRNFGQDVDQGDRLTNTGTSDLDMRTQYAAWKQYMTTEVRL